MYYIRETRTWKGRWNGCKEILYYGKEKKPTSNPVMSKIAFIYLFKNHKSAENRLEQLKTKAKLGWYESEWEIICEDIQ